MKYISSNYSNLSLDEINNHIVYVNNDLMKMKKQ